MDDLKDVFLGASMKDLHVTLPDSLAEETDRLASDTGETRNSIVRRALEDFIASEKKRRRACEMKSYARKMAGKSGDFVTASEAAVSRKILRETRW
jgi:predicted transcriptional regulator